uniref:Uncharacterized protein n=1 Tax=Arundo donax TaxID=35708 RepID=A0A0A8ZB09_ARUDO
MDPLSCCPAEDQGEEALNQDAINTSQTLPCDHQSSYGRGGCRIRNLQLKVLCTRRKINFHVLKGRLVLCAQG